MIWGFELESGPTHAGPDHSKFRNSKELKPPEPSLPPPLSKRAILDNLAKGPNPVA